LFFALGEGDVLECLSETISEAAIPILTRPWSAPGWGTESEIGLPAALIDCIDDGPFGPKHLRRLAGALAAAKFAGNQKVAGYALAHSTLRNVLLVPVILGHACSGFFPH